MPYIYNATKQARELIVRFQHNKVPLPITIAFLKFLTRQIEIIFSSYQYDETIMLKIVRNVFLREFEEIAKFDKAVPEMQTVAKLKAGDVETFKHTIGEQELEKETIEKYADLSSDFVFSHLAILIGELGKIVVKRRWEEVQRSTELAASKKMKIEQEAKPSSHGVTAEQTTQSNAMLPPPAGAGTIANRSSLWSKSSSPLRVKLGEKRKSPSPTAKE